MWPHQLSQARCRREGAHLFVGEWHAAGLPVGRVPVLLFGSLRLVSLAIGLELGGRPGTLARGAGRAHEGAFPSTSSLWVHPVEVAAGECVAVIASTPGPSYAGALSLRESGHEHGMPWDDVARAHRETVSPVMHVQACATAPAAWVAQMWSASSPHSTRFTVLRASASAVGGNAGLNRGYVPHP